MRASLVGKPAIPLVSFTVSDIGDRSALCEPNSKASRQNQAESSGSNAVHYVMISRGAVSLLSVDGPHRSTIWFRIHPKMPRCTRKGCGQEYDTAANTADDCTYHSGAPVSSPAV